MTRHKKSFELFPFVFALTLIFGGILISNRPALAFKFGLKGNQQTKTQELLTHKEINVNGQVRSFEYFIPKTGTPKLMPVLIALHGGGGHGEQMAKSSELIATAEKYKVIIVFPNGSGKKSDGLLTWNADHCCGFAMKTQSDDINFISKTIDYAIDSLGGDKKRIYVTGISNGAMMTQKAAIALPNKITAIATVVGTLFGDESLPKAPVPALIINGAIDDHIPLNGGPPQKNTFAWDGKEMKPVSYLGQFWSNANHCNSKPQISETSDLILYNFTCPSGNDVRQVIVKDGGHEWFGGNAGRPGKGAPSQSFQTNEEIMRFFLSHSK